MAAHNNQRPKILRRGPMIFITIVFVVPFLLWNALGAASCKSMGGEVRWQGMGFMCFMDFSGWEPGRPIQGGR